MDPHSPGCDKLYHLQFCGSLPACITENHHQMAIVATSFQGSGWERGLVCCLYLNLSGPGQGWLRDFLPVWAPGPKDHYSIYLATGRADSRQASVEGTSFYNLPGTSAQTIHIGTEQSKDASTVSGQIPLPASAVKGSTQSMSPCCKSHPHPCQSWT